jgi:transcriptional regulator
MYVPEHFSDQDSARAFALMAKYPFGLVITVTGGEPFVTHVPFKVDEARQRVMWHLAAANPQAAHLVQGAATKLVFQGPHAYISPRWYATTNVPTWNYAAVHVTGKISPLETETTAALVAAISRDYEGSVGLGEFESTPRYAAMTLAIRGFSLQIESLQGKYKLSQNRPLEDQHKVAARLLDSADQSSREIGEMMRATLKEH